MYTIKIVKHINDSFNGSEADITQEITGFTSDELSTFTTVQNITTDNYTGTSFFKQAPRKAKLKLNLVNIIDSNDTELIYNNLVYPSTDLTPEYAKDFAYTVYYSDGTTDGYSSGDIVSESIWESEGNQNDNTDEIFSDISRLGIRIYQDGYNVYSGLLNKAVVPVAGKTIELEIVDGLFILSKMLDIFKATGIDDIEIYNIDEESEAKIVSIIDMFSVINDLLQDNIQLNLNIDIDTISNEAYQLYEDIALSTWQQPFEYSGTKIIGAISEAFVQNIFRAYNESAGNMSDIVRILPIGNNHFYFPIQDYSQGNALNDFPHTHIYVSLDAIYTPSSLSVIQASVYAHNGYAYIWQNSDSINFGDYYSDNNYADLTIAINNLVTNVVIEFLQGKSSNCSEDSNEINSLIVVYGYENDSVSELCTTATTKVFYPDSLSQMLTWVDEDNPLLNITADVEISGISRHLPINVDASMKDVLQTYLFFAKKALITDNDFTLSIIDRLPATAEPITQEFLAITRQFEKISISENESVTETVTDLISFTGLSKNHMISIKKYTNQIVSSYMNNRYRTKCILLIAAINDDNYGYVLPNQLDVVDLSISDTISCYIKYSNSKIVKHNVYIVGISIEKNLHKVTGFIMS